MVDQIQRPGPECREQDDEQGGVDVQRGFVVGDVVRVEHVAAGQGEAAAKERFGQRGRETQTAGEGVGTGFRVVCVHDVVETAGDGVHGELIGDLSFVLESSVECETEEANEDEGDVRSRP